MPLWTHNGATFVKTSQARIDLPLPVLLCCPGPSLQEITRDLRGPGRLVGALNSAYPQVRPDIWFGLDRLACHPAKLWHEAFTKVTRMIAGDTDRVRHRMNVIYADVEAADPAEMFLRRGDNCSLVWCGNTLAFALHYLLFIGAKRIHFVGCDMGGARDYYDERILTPAQRASNRTLYEGLVLMIERLSILGRSQGITFLSSTRHSPLNDFLEYQPLDDVLAEVEATLPVEVPLRHSSEAV